MINLFFLSLQKSLLHTSALEDLVLTMEEFKHFYRDTEPWVSSEVGTTCGEYNEFKPPCSACYFALM